MFTISDDSSDFIPEWWWEEMFREFEWQCQQAEWSGENIYHGN